MGTEKLGPRRFLAASTLILLILLLGSGGWFCLGPSRAARLAETSFLHDGAAGGDTLVSLPGISGRVAGVACSGRELRNPPAANRLLERITGAAAAVAPVPVDRRIVNLLFWLSGALCMGIRR